MEEGYIPEEWDIGSGTIRAWNSNLAAQDVAKEIIREAINRAITELKELGYNDLKAENLIFSAGVPANTVGSDRLTILGILRELGVATMTSADIVEEPALALVPHYLVKNIDVGDRILVCDIGGGTTDLAIIHFERDDDDRLTSTVGLVHGRKFLGGSDIDQAISQFLVSKIAEAEGESPELGNDIFGGQGRANRLLKKETIRIKEDLGVLSEVRLDPDVAEILGSEDSTIRVTQDDLDRLLNESRVLDKVKACIEEAVYINDVIDNGGFEIRDGDSGGIKWVKRRSKDEIRDYFDKVFLVGGTCNMPQVRDALVGFLADDPDIIGDPDNLVPPQLATVMGAAERMVLDFTASLRQPPFDVFLSCPDAKVYQRLFTAYDTTWDIDAINRRNFKSFTTKFQRYGDMEHFLSIEEHGETAHTEPIRFPDAYPRRHPATFELDSFGRCIINFEWSNHPQIVQFFKYQTETQKRLLERKEADEAEREARLKTRTGGFLDPRADRDNNA